jgi:flagellar P-ring protein precursor FlgI
MPDIWRVLSILGVVSSLLSAADPISAPARTRLKEFVTVEGVRDNQLFGYGLVVGLNGTGDRRQTIFAAQSLSNLLQRMGVTVTPTAMQVLNTAAVMVTATLPPFAQPGTRLDISVAALGDAKNLQGGLLLLTSLKAANGQTYAVAQGPVVTGGFVAGGGGNTQTVNHPTSGRVPSGAIVEQGPPSSFGADEIHLQLRQGDFTNASRIAALINREFGEPIAPIARASNPSLVSVDLPANFRDRPVEFLSLVENLTIELDSRPRIVVNERTGTIVLGKELRIKPVAILHGNLTVEVQTQYAVSQPAPLSQGQTTTVPQVGVGVKADPARNVSLQEGASVENLVQALVVIKSTPRDIIAILQALQAAGALDAEIEVI